MNAAALVLALALLLPRTAGAEPLKVLASFLPMYVFTRNVAGDAPGVSVDMMLPAALGCPHDYALTPADMRKIAAADLFIANGLGMEEFLGSPVRKANPRVKIVETAAGVAPLPGGGANPHTWVSPRNAIVQVRAIEKALSAASPANAPLFRRNADAYAARLAALAARFETASRGYRNRNVAAFHGIFDYLARDAGLTVVGHVEETSGEEPSAGELRGLIGTIRRTRAAAVFAEPQYPTRLAEMVGREAGVPVRTLDPLATGSAAPTAYEDAMVKNLATLIDTLGAADRGAAGR